MIAFDQQDADTICAALSEGHSLASICEAMGILRITVYRWAQQDAAFAEAMRMAKELGCHHMADECLAIADDGRNDWMERQGQDGQGAGLAFNSDHVQRSRLRIDTRMRLIGKWLPKVYGDKLAVGGADDLPPIKTMDDAALSARIAALQAKLNVGDKS